MNIEERFWNKVDKTEGCWYWIAGTSSGGYGQFYLDGLTLGAHRVSYELKYGKPELHVLHTCDTPSCVNPDHLFEGTDLDNARDREAKGRGCHLPTTKGKRILTKEQIKEVQFLGAFNIGNKRIAHQFNVSSTLISEIINRRGRYSE